MATAPPATAPVATATSGLRKPSGMCMGLLGAARAQTGDREVGEVRREPGLRADELAHGVQPARRDGPHGAAAIAQQVLAGAIARERVQPGAVPEVDVADEP